MTPKTILLLGPYSAHANALAEDLRDVFDLYGSRTITISFDGKRIEKIFTLIEKTLTSVSGISNASLIITGLEGTLWQVKEFVETLKAYPHLPQEIVCFNVKLQKITLAETVAAELTVDYGENHGWKTGTVIYDGHPEKAVIDSLAFMSGNSQRAVICGQSITGKGTVNQGIKDILGYEICSAGNDVSREFAKQKGMSLDEVVLMTKTDPKFGKEYDKMIDDWNISILKSKKKMSLECRLGALFAKPYDTTPDPVYKTLFTISNQVAGERLFKLISDGDERKAQLGYKTVETAIAGTMERNAIDHKRYLDLYQGYDYLDPKHYNHVMDSGNTPKIDMVPTWLAGYKKFLFNLID